MVSFFYLIVSTFPGSSATRALIRFPQMNGASCSLTSPRFRFDIILFGFPVKVNNSVSMYLNRQEERERERTVSRKTMSDVSGSFCQFWKRRDFWRFKVSQPVCGGSRRLQSKMIIHDPSDNKR